MFYKIEVIILDKWMSFISKGKNVVRVLKNGIDLEVKKNFKKLNVKKLNFLR